tara:strand:+ start:246 stop:398 length:153 start_codon:yes stop_codon:yes gene_type:complete
MMDIETLQQKIEQPIRALAKELETRGQMNGLAQEIIANMLKTIRETKETV